MGSPNVRRDNRNQGSSRFNVSARRDLQKLPLLKGKCQGEGVGGLGGDVLRGIRVGKGVK